MSEKEAENILITGNAQFIGSHDNASVGKYKDYYLAQYGNK